MERVRKNEQEKLPGRHRKYFKKSRYLLMKPMKKIDRGRNGQAFSDVRNGSQTCRCLQIKNEFLKVSHSNSSAEGRQKLIDWLFSAELMKMEEFQACINAYRNWSDEILNAMDVPWTNGYIEGRNNKTKVLKRVCFGMRNFRNFRKRILFCNT